MHPRSINLTLLTLACFMWANTSSATMKPETPMLFIMEKDGGGSINVTNTDDQTELLYVKIHEMKDDPEPKLYVTQPVMRLESGKTQLVRFILNSDHPLQEEHLKRVTFEGIRPKTHDNENRIDVNIRQNIPVIIHPKGLAMNDEPWKALVWNVKNNTLTVNNPSPYVVRLSQQVTLLPQDKKALLSKTYILPQQTLSLVVNNAVQLSSIQKVSIETVSKYGFETGKIEMPVTH
ncbi:fimbria/pilus chaperone family protein [Erwinia sp. JUb26]|uniref:fimbria/pilus chaperone family protein n=1 Tax=Erwinia sp. JUb26 TaxID=2485126 RepID=UPI000F469D11|nr:fimbria/pilus chaperone family protein [Erwinia sp. JUb26]ROR13593.1 P pilus assembly chaperone PapD [Erwinia sp. JUb26]